jgi:hypothetical protein
VEVSRDRDCVVMDAITFVCWLLSHDFPFVVFEFEKGSSHHVRDGV